MIIADDCFAVCAGYADLALPDYLSKIVNNGIQQGGVQNAVPTAIRQSEMNKLVLFMNAGDRALVLDAYTLVDKTRPTMSSTSSNTPILANEPVYVLETDRSDRRSTS